MTPFLQNVATDIVKKYGDSLDKICIVVPSQRAHTFLLSYFSKVIKTAFIAPKIVTIDEFMSTISGLQPIDNTQLLLEMFMLNKTMNPSSDNDMIKFSGWAQQFLGDINDIDLHLVDAQSLFTSVADIKELSLFGIPELERSPRQLAWVEFFKKLHSFYAQFNISLLNRHSGYQGMIYRYVAEHIHELIENIGYQKMIFCGFNALTVAEQKTIKTLIEKGLADTYWDADSYYIDDPMRDAGQFLRQNFNLLKIDAPKFMSTDYADIPKNIHLVAAQNNVAQAKYVGQLLAEAETYNLDLDKTVIVPADENLLIPLLHAIPVNNVNITMGLPISQTNLFSFFMLLFDMQQNVQRTAEIRPRDKDKIYVKDILAIINHPYSTSVFEYNEITSEQIKQQLQRSKKSFYTVKELQKLIGKSKLEGFILLTFSVWENALVAINSITELLSLFVKVLITNTKSTLANKNPEKLIFSNTANALQQVLERLNQTAQLYQEVIDIVNLRFLFDTEAHKETLSFKGNAQQGLQLMGVLETRTLDFENIIFLSINEGVLPSGKAVTSLIPHDVKRYFKLPSYQYKDAVFSYHFFRLIQRASEVYLLYNSGSSDGKAERSRFIEQLVLELPKYNVQTKIHRQLISFDSSITRLPEISFEKTPEIMTAISAIPRFSPSSLSKYINCTLQFYFSYVQKIKEPDDILEHADDATLGNVIHGVLEEVLTPFLNAVIDLKKLPKINIEDLVTRHFANPKNKIILSKEDLEHGKNRLVYEIAIRYVQHVLDTERENSGSYTLRYLEQELTHVLQLGKNEVKLYGKADRIDELSDGEVRIIDYKTGSVDVTKLKIKDIQTLFIDPQKGKAFQLMMYALLYQYSISKEHQVSSGIVSTRDKSAPFNPLIVGDSDIISSEILQEFEELLTDMLQQLFDSKTPFKQTEDVKRCLYCVYKSICNR
jgi:RecB family exonuclease